jgi:hypothetical protein
MNEDRTPGTLVGLVVFVGSIGGLFLIARLTHIAMAIAKDPAGIPAEAWSQAGMVLVGVALAGGVVAGIRLTMARHHGPLHHGAVGHTYSHRAS